MQLKYFDDREKKIFLTVFLILGIFVQWYGVNANSRFDLTRSIAEEGTLNINSTYQNTGDRSVYKNTYYSDKEPGLSLLASPIYATWKTVYGVFGDTEVHQNPRKEILEINNESITYPEEPGEFYLSAIVLTILLTSTLSVSLLSILVYRISENFLEKKRDRTVLALAFAFGTLITHYGTMFLPDAPAALLAFLSFYLIYKNKDIEVKRISISGIIGGLAVTFTLTSFVVLVFNFLYLILNEKEIPFRYIYSGFLGGLPFMIYNQLAFGAFWRLPRNYLDPALFPQFQNSIGLFINSETFFIAFRLLFMPYRGLFYWFPILILSIIGFWYLYRDDRNLGLYIGGLFISTVFLVSTYGGWWYGGWFGPRHLTLLMPFLMIPIFYGFKKTGYKLLVPLLAISLIVNLAGFQGVYENTLKEETASNMIDKYEKKIGSLEILFNPVNDYYISGLIQNGLRSSLIDELQKGEFPPDIRSYSENMPESNTLAVLFSIIAVIFLVWNLELKFRKIFTRKMERLQDYVYELSSDLKTLELKNYPNLKENLLNRHKDIPSNIRSNSEN